MLHGYFDIPTFHYFEEKTPGPAAITPISATADPVLGDEKSFMSEYGTAQNASRR